MGWQDYCGEDPWESYERSSEELFSFDDSGSTRTSTTQEELCFEAYTVVKHTSKATLFTIDGDNYWVPKSVYEIDEAQDLIIPGWFELTVVKSFKPKQIVFDDISGEE